MQADITQRTSSYSRRFHVTLLLRIRWLAVTAQTIALFFTAFYLNFHLPFAACLFLIALSAWLNLFLTFRYPSHHRLDPSVTMILLGFDILQFTLLLYLTGGLQNPFSILMLGPPTIAAASLNLRYILILNILVFICVSFLAYDFFPLPWYDEQEVLLPRLWIDGMWAAIVAALVFFTSYAYRISEQTRQLGDALAATELMLQRENHLSNLDGLAAAAAHELGTPLATIQLVVKEMGYALKQQPEFQEDMELLSSQITRCRDILQRLTSLSTDDNEDIYNMSITSMLEDTAAPHRNFGVGIELEQEPCEGAEPVFKRNQGLLFGLGNLIENAVDFAKSKVIIRYYWTDEFVRITILDDGPGYPPVILDRIGEPYTTSRVADQHGGGLGLGLFIAKTLLERSGAQIYFGNSYDQAYGAEIRMQWLRKHFETKHSV